MDVYLVRHTTVAVGRDTCYGRTDVDVGDTFAAEAAAIEEKLGPTGDSVVYTSPLSRCVKLAERLGSGQPVPDQRIIEFDFGQWEMKTWDSIDRAELGKWSEDFINSSCPGGESFHSLYHRSCVFWDELISRREKNAVVVTHYGIIHALLAYILGMPLEKSFRISIDYGGLTKVRVGRKRVTVEYINR